MIIPAPYWVSYPDMVLASDGVPVTVACPEANGFKLTPAQLEAAITPRTRWLLLNSPSNPTGASYTAAEYRALADVLARHPQVLVMTDDIYEHIRFDGQRTPHLLNAAPELRDRTLAINGVSKTYAMTGWRIGWVAGPRDLVQALDTLLSQSDRQLLLGQPGRRGRGAERRPELRRRERRDLPAAARPHAGAHQRDPRPDLPRARRRLLPLHQLRRPDRQDHARRQAARPKTATS